MPSSQSSQWCGGFGGVSSQNVFYVFWCNLQLEPGRGPGRPATHQQTMTYSPNQAFCKHRICSKLSAEKCTQGYGNPAQAVVPSSWKNLTVKLL